MMENRSYDQMLGYLSLGDNPFKNTDGLTGAEFNEDEGDIFLYDIKFSRMYKASGKMVIFCETKK